MAQVDLLRTTKIVKNRNVIHDKVSCTYTTFDDSGNKYMQIDTYGRIERENPEKISQSLQFNKESAIFFVDLMIREFDLNIK